MKQLGQRGCTAELLNVAEAGARNNCSTPAREEEAEKTNTQPRPHGQAQERAAARASGHREAASGFLDCEPPRQAPRVRAQKLSRGNKPRMRLGGPPQKGPSQGSPPRPSLNTGCHSSPG